MIKIEELIKKLCPNGVVYCALNKVFDNFNGMTGVSNKWKENGNCRFIEYMNAYKNLKIKVQQLPLATVKKLEQNTLKKGDILLTSASETPDECAISSVIEDEIQDNVFLDDHLFGLRLKEKFNEKINTIFINYYMHTRKFRRCVNKTVRGVTRFYISVSDFMNICIPVPPLEVQDEIVRILDDFTLLSAEPSAELKARQKQYEYYIKKVLSFDKNIERKRLKELVIFKNGKGHEKDIVEDGKYIVINSKFISTKGEVKKYSNKQLCPLDIDDILMVMSDLPNGKALAKCFLVDENNKYSLNQRIGCFHVLNKNIINTKFLFYVLNRNKQLLRYDNGVDQTNLRKDDILYIEIPIPELRKQIQIVDILDKFNDLSFNISEGLPAEIEARKKQYEYYRDKLLTFKELEIKEG